MYGIVQRPRALSDSISIQIILPVYKMFQIDLDGFGWRTTTDDARDGGSGKLVSHFTASSGS